MRTVLLLAVTLFWASAAHAQPLNPPLRDLAALLDRHGYGDVRSVEAEQGTLTVMARMADGRPVRVSVDERLGTVSEVPGRLLFVHFAAPATPQMTFGELAALLDEAVPGGKLVEAKRNQGAYEVHLRAVDGRALGMLIDVNTRKMMSYHSQD